MKRMISILVCCLLSPVVLADKSDYIWNQQFEKKMVKAEAGDLKGMYDVGNMYLKGQGTTRNAEEAFKWFKKGADKGYTRSEYKVGYLYHRGEGVKKNNRQAFKWIERAAKGDYKPAMYYLGKLYAKGDGVSENTDRALEWYKKAYAKGYNPAKREIERLEARLAQRQAAPAPRPAARPKPIPKPVSRPAPRKTVAARLGPKQVKQILAKNSWHLNGKPSEVFPSAITKCKESNGMLKCESQEQETDEDYGVVSYKMQATFGGFTDKGEFNGEFRKNVTLIFPNDPDDPNVVIPINYGPQEKQLMRCKVIGDGLTCYRGINREKVTYNKF